jgi:FkbM family methyltransferase
MEDGSALLHCEGTSGHNSLLSVGSTSEETYEVRVRRGADFVKDRAPALVKIDVEGWELDVLAGFGKHVGNGKSVFVIE